MKKSVELKKNRIQRFKGKEKEQDKKIINYNGL